MMATSQQRTDLLEVLCACQGDEHALSTDGCTATVKAGTYSSWKPTPGQFGKYPSIPVADIYVELARLAPDRAAAKRYRSQAATLRHSNRYWKP